MLRPEHCPCASGVRLCFSFAPCSEAADTSSAFPTIASCSRNLSKFSISDLLHLHGSLGQRKLPSQRRPGPSMCSVQVSPCLVPASDLRYLTISIPAMSLARFQRDVRYPHVFGGCTFHFETSLSVLQLMPHPLAKSMRRWVLRWGNHQRRIGRPFWVTGRVQFLILEISNAVKQQTQATILSISIWPCSCWAASKDVARLAMIQGKCPLVDHENRV